MMRLGARPSLSRRHHGDINPESGPLSTLEPPRLEVENLAIRVGSREILRHVSLNLAAGELLGVIGPNGAGKSSLLKAIVQLLPYQGRICVCGDDLRQLAGPERARRIAYLSQEDRLQWPISVRDLVALARHPYRGGWWQAQGEARGDDASAIERALRATDVWTLRNRPVTELSGGERARARLARVLAVEADLLLADEPVAALDPWHQLNMMEQLRAHCARRGSAMVVMHDLTLASRYCTRLLLLDQGRAVALGSPAKVLTQDRLRRVYGIATITGQIAGETYVLPWSVVDR